MRLPGFVVLVCRPGVIGRGAVPGQHAIVFRGRCRGLRTCCPRRRKLRISERVGLFDAARRLWRTIKYEEAYSHACPTVAEARASFGRYLTLYNARRPHSSLADRTPEQAYLSRARSRPRRNRSRVYIALSVSLSVSLSEKAEPLLGSGSPST